jgi:glutaredoxin-dependent peroxiredoxin
VNCYIVASRCIGQEEPNSRIAFTEPFDRPQANPILIFMALTVGSKAPDFSLPTKTADGPRPVKLSDNFGKKNTLLLFFPMAFTGTCTTEMCETSNALDSYAGMNAEVYGISGDNPFAQEAWAQKEKIGVTLLSDYEHRVTKAYDVAYDAFLPQLNLGMAGVAKRSAFIVDKNGVIQYVESLEDARQLPDFEKIKAKLNEMK